MAHMRMALWLAFLAVASFAGGCRTVAPDIARRDLPSHAARGLGASGWVALADGGRMRPEGEALPALVERLARSDIVLLGEVHDDPRHHRLQAWLLGRLLARGARPALVFEMMNRDQAPFVDEVTAGRRYTPNELFARTGWAARGWPNVGDYAPLVALADAFGLPIVAANLDPRQMRALFFDAGAGWNGADREAVGLDVPLPPARARALLDDLARVHGGSVPAATLAKMAAIQRARDGQFARQLAAACGAARRRAGANRPPAPCAALIAGADHARLDRGVGWHLARLAPHLRVFSLALAPLAAEAAPPAFDPRILRHDAVWFTAAGSGDLQPAGDAPETVEAVDGPGHA